ncbi:MAG: deoxyribodipyrimidine photolyase [Planctomycetes bacterium]|nr:deoxyribodipyrimidine photolyase [Planctomycetota bacterium]
MSPRQTTPVQLSDSDVPASRVRCVHDQPPRADRSVVLYWMIAARRTHWNFALQRAVDWCRTLRKPLVVLEPLRCDYRWASDRLHRFVIEGMADNAKRLDRNGVTYFPYIEPSRGADAELLKSLAQHAAVVVTDDYPAFFLPGMVAIAARQIDVRFEAVDANGLMPLSAHPKEYLRAVDFRRHLQRDLPDHLVAMPDADPFHRARLPEAWPLPRSMTRRWKPATAAQLTDPTALIRSLPIDHSVGPAVMHGGTNAAVKTLADFLGYKLPRYEDEGNHPDTDVTSNLSHYLHFGHIAPHEVFAALAQQERWNPARLSGKANGRREGWWGMGVAAESFLDQLITWRELGFNMCSHRRDYARYSSLPDWAIATLAKHSKDRREHVYTLEEFAAAATHDPVWNACQRQLLQEGRMHNYLRMLWGKKILEWTSTPQVALRIMIELNNRYAVDGRDPNSYSGIFWVLGRYDRPWAPERPIFGRIRYMSSANTSRKLRMRQYMERYGA